MIWVLTGDKIETAINVGYSSGLIDGGISQFIISAMDENELATQMREIKETLTTYPTREVALVVAGDSLMKITHSLQFTATFLELTAMAKVVLACRVSPKQKAEIVLMIRK